jgi:AcrR family transcriptional regulator
VYFLSIAILINGNKMRIRKTATERKCEIISTALQLADTIGPDRVTTHIIAQTIGISQPGIFRHFPKKEQLWQAVAEALGEKMVLTWQQACQKHQQPLDQLIEVVLAQLALIEKTPAIPALLFSRELHSSNESLRLSFMKNIQEFHTFLGDLVANSIKEGQLTDEVDGKDLVLLIIGLIQGIAMRWSMSGKQLDIVAEGERLLFLQLKGFIK